MVKGKIKSELSKEAILSKISSYDIYRFYQGPFKVNVVTVNHHRGEKDPSLVIGNKLSPELTHKDYGDYSWRGDCFHFVQKIHSCDFKMALSIINRDFNLGLNGSKIDTERKIITWEKPDLAVKKAPLLQIIPGTFEKKHWDWWGRFYQGEEDINREHIYVPKQIWRNKRRISLGDELTFCYYYPELDKWKIYRPNAPKRSKDTPVNQWKWDTNIPFNHMENLQSVIGAKKALLAKSKKDRMVLRKALEMEAIGQMQAEDPSALTEEALEIYSKVPKKWAVMDNDKKGKEVSWWLTDNHEFKHCNVPDKYQPQCTDFASIADVYDLEKVRKHFKLKGVI